MASAQHAPPTTLTEEQKENIRKNRENALRIRAAKEQERQQNTITAEQRLRIQENMERAKRLREQKQMSLTLGSSSNQNLNFNVPEHRGALEPGCSRQTPGIAMQKKDIVVKYHVGQLATNLPKPRSTITMKVIDAQRIAVIAFPYHDAINEMLRKVPSRVYDAKTRRSIILVKDLRVCENLLRKIPNVEITIDTIPEDVFKILTRSDLLLQAIPNDLSLMVDPDLINIAYEYQLEGIKFGLERNGRVLIADEMGLGKSIQALGIARYYKSEWPLVIICPAAVTTSWKDAILRFLPYSIKEERIHLLMKKSDPIPIDHRSTTILIMSYEQMKIREVELIKNRYQTYIFDESHQLKDRKANRTVTALKLSKLARHVILLSGTPALSKPAELFTQIKMIDSTMFPKFESFAIRYCDGREGAFGFEAKGCTNSEELSAILSKSLMIRRMKNDVLEKLPAKKRELIFIEDSQIDLKLESLQAAKSLFEKSNKNNSSFSNKSGSFDSLLEYYRETGVAKANAVADHVIKKYFNGFEDGILPTRKVLIFGHHQIVLDTVQHEISRRGIGFIRIDGTTTQTTRGLHCDRFQNDDSCFVAILSMTAAGVGITLTAASIVIFAELHWTPGTLHQAEDRAHRVGQLHEVLVQYMVAKNTADDHLLPMLERKMDMLGQVSLTSDSFVNAARKHETFGKSQKRPLDAWLEEQNMEQFHSLEAKREKDDD